jgi:MFS family permease
MSDKVIGATPPGASASPAGTMTGTAQPLSRGYVTYALWMLLIVYTLNFLDRQIINILAAPIREEFDLSGLQMGLLGGLAFAFIYTVLGIPIARYADRLTSNRVGIIAIALAVWSGFTALCGLAQNYWQLLAARIGVGVGEAGCTPPAHSLISDKVPPEKRASALAFYSMGVPIGTFIAFVAGGAVAQEFGWRMAFLMVGLPGVLLAIIFWMTIKEPRKLGLVAPPAADAPKVSFGQALKELAGIRAYWYACAAAAVIAFLGYGQNLFLGNFYEGAHGMTLAERGLWLGIVIGLGGAFGTWLGGVIADRAAQKDTRAYFSVPAIAMVASIPFFVGAMLVEERWASLALLVIPTLLNSLWYGPVYAAVQSVVVPRLRATAVAIMLFIINMIGLGFGPLALGGLWDFLAKSMGMGEVEGLRWAILLSSSLGLLAVALFWIGRGTIREDLERARTAV